MPSNQLNLLKFIKTHSLSFVANPWLKVLLFVPLEKPSVGFLSIFTAGTMMPLHWTAIAVHCYLLLALAEAESETCSVQNASCGRALLQKQLTGSQAANCRPILIHFSECSDGEHWRAL